jgi:hypothetical protein
MHVYVSVLLICPFVSWKYLVLTQSGEEVRSERDCKALEMKVLQHSHLIHHSIIEHKLTSGDTRRIMYIPKRRVFLICGAEDFNSLEREDKASSRTGSTIRSGGKRLPTLYNIQCVLTFRATENFATAFAAEVNCLNRTQLEM